MSRRINFKDVEPAVTYLGSRKTVVKEINGIRIPIEIKQVLTDNRYLENKVEALQSTITFIKEANHQVRLQEMSNQADIEQVRIKNTKVRSIREVDCAHLFIHHGKPIQNNNLQQRFVNEASLKSISITLASLTVIAARESSRIKQYKLDVARLEGRVTSLERSLEKEHRVRLFGNGGLTVESLQTKNKKIHKEYNKLYVSNETLQLSKLKADEWNARILNDKDRLELQIKRLKASKTTTLEVNNGTINLYRDEFNLGEMDDELINQIIKVGNSNFESLKYLQKERRRFIGALITMIAIAALAILGVFI